MLEKIRVMGIFIICAQAVIHFSPGKAYHKYLRLLLSIMVLVQLLQPLISTLFGTQFSLPEGWTQWEQLQDERGMTWESMAGYEEQIQAIWQQAVEHGAQQYEGQQAAEGEAQQCEGQQAAESEGQREQGAEEKPPLISPVSIQINPIEQGGTAEHGS